MGFLAQGISTWKAILEKLMSPYSPQKLLHSHLMSTCFWIDKSSFHKAYILEGTEKKNELISDIKSYEENKIKGRVLWERENTFYVICHRRVTLKREYASDDLRRAFQTVEIRRTKICSQK